MGFLIDGGEFDAAHLVLACSHVPFNYMSSSFDGAALEGPLFGPRAVYDAIGHSLR